MQLKIIQTVSAIKCQYDIVMGENRVGSAVLNDNVTGLGTYDICYKNDSVLLEFDVDTQIKSLVKQPVDRSDSPYRVIINGQLCGDIYSSYTNNSFFTRISFDRLHLYDREYEMYKVGLGKEGIKFPIYCGEQQIALIEKDYTVHNNLDAYNIYSLDEHAAFVAIIFGFKLDKSYSHGGMAVSKSVEKDYLLTLNKELRSKYNPDFKQMVIDFDN